MNGSGLLYRTPSDVRAIPNEQWETWLRNGSLPFDAFPAERRCQMVLRSIVNATQRRAAAETAR